MRFYQNRQFEMLQNVAAFLKNNRDKLSARVPALRDFIKEYTEGIDELYRIQNSNKNLTRISTIEKKSVRATLVEMTLKLSGVLVVHYHKNRNERIRKNEQDAKPGAVMKYNVSELNRATADKLIKIAKQVIGAVKKIKFVGRYGINVEYIKDAEAYYKEFVAIKQEPEKRKKSRAAQNQTLVKGTKDGIAFLENSIDPLMPIATAEDPQLLSSYKSWRTVLPKGQGRPSDKETAYRKSRKKKKEKPNKANSPQP